MSLTDALIRDGWLKAPNIIEAFRKIKREDFITDNVRHLAELNEALPIGFGQTISQPLVVAFMLELLSPESGDNILDVGSGSGWTTGLLAFIVRQNSDKGRVVAVEVIPEIYEFGKKNIDKYNFIKDGAVECILGDGKKGFKKYSPYDKILLSAASQSGPSEELKRQLKIGGKLVCPIKNSIWLFIKKNNNEFEKKEYPGFIFVPLV